MLQSIAAGELAACWIAWFLAFITIRKRASGYKKVATEPSYRWGIFLMMIGFMLVWMRVRPAGFEKSDPALIVSMMLGPPSVALAWFATRHLGKQWRFEAAIREGHELVQTGPYRFVRHPIYASMLGMLLTTGACLSWWPMVVAGLIAFIAGTEIRIRAEDRLLAEHFGTSFATYRSRVPAYLPFVR